MKYLLLSGRFIFESKFLVRRLQPAVSPCKRRWKKDIGEASTYKHKWTYIAKGVSKMQ